MVGVVAVRFAAILASRKGAARLQVAIIRAKLPLVSQRRDLQAAGIVGAVSEVGHPSTRRRELVLVVVALA